MKDHLQTSGFLSDATPNVIEFLARHGLESTGLLGLNKKMRYVEGVVAPGETVCVVGRAHWETDPEPDRGYREAGKRLHVVPPGGGARLFMTDDPEAMP